eukprot:6802497-Lingulodinium_polyedra.AAC.1
MSPTRSAEVLQLARALQPRPVIRSRARADCRANSHRATHHLHCLLRPRNHGPPDGHLAAHASRH